MVGETAKKGTLMAILAMLMVLPLASHCGASASIRVNGSGTSPSHGRMDEPEPMFDSMISRMLISFSHVTDGTSNPSKAAVSDCNRPPKYLSCLPGRDGKPRPPNCMDGAYNRNC